MNLNDFGYSTDYAHQCAAWTLNPYGKARKQCALPPNRNIDQWVYLCNRHYDLIFKAIEGEVDDLNSRRVKNLQSRLHQAEDALRDAEQGIMRNDIIASMEEVERKRKAQIVYFIRCQQFVKIGISKNPAARLQQIRRGGGSHFPRLLDVETSELIATEAGGFAREKELHARFAHLRHTGEWFTEAPELTEYIESLSERSAA